MIIRNKHKRAEAKISKASNIISAETVLEGDMTTSGNIGIEGTVCGNVKTEARVVVAQSALVEGYVIAQEVTVAGKIKGGVEVKGLLILKSTSHVQGDIVANDLIVEEGAVFEGRCLMGIMAKDFQIEKDRKSKKLSRVGKSQENREKSLIYHNFQRELKFA